MKRMEEAAADVLAPEGGARGRLRDRLRPPGRPRRPGRRARIPFAQRLRRWVRGALVALAAFLLVATIAGFSYDLATDGPAPRPAGLRFVAAGGFDTRYLAWGTAGTPVVLVPGAFETADTFDAFGPVLAAEHHRVYAIDLTGTGYSAPSPPYSAEHLADQVVAFLRAEHLTGANAAILVGHSAGAADVGIAAVRAPDAVRGVVFLDGDATPLNAPTGLFVPLMLDPYRTALLRLALSSDALIRAVYDSQCGPGCPQLDAQGVNTWRRPLEQPGFADEITYTMSHGITAMTDAEFAALHAAPVPKLVVAGVDDPQMDPADAEATAQRIGAPGPVYVPGRHLTMIASPGRLASVISAFAAAAP
jgi:pimeloyl-ACP methyl ester carboxylesterase